MKILFSKHVYCSDHCCTDIVYFTKSFAIWYSFILYLKSAHVNYPVCIFLEQKFIAYCLELWFHLNYTSKKNYFGSCNRNYNYFLINPFTAFFLRIRQRECTKQINSNKTFHKTFAYSYYIFVFCFNRATS